MMTPSGILDFDLNDSTLDLLNAAIASHQVKMNNQILSIEDFKTENDFLLSEGAVTQEQDRLLNVHSKRELEKDDQTISPPKRAGRKPLDKSQIPDASLDPKQKRKAQNRAAQRAFRDRKEKHVSELQARIDELEALNATKDKELLKENERLKEMLQKLQEENHSLKEAQFTFEFPIPDHHFSSYSKDPIIHSFNSSYSEDTSSSNEQSPLSNSHGQEDETTSTDTPMTNHVSFVVDPTQFGLLQPELSNLDFLAINPTLVDDVTQTMLPEGDLFHGKDDLFANYHIPPNGSITDDFLLANEDLTRLFGTTSDDLFTVLNEFNLPVRRSIPEEKKEMMYQKLKQLQKEGKYVYQGYQEIKQTCPDFDLDLLCQDMRKKATCSMSTLPITDTEVNAFMKCLDHV